VSGGRVGYLHLATFTTAGYSEFVRQFHGQAAKEGLIIDSRWSAGGSVGGLLTDLLNRPPLNSAASRYSGDNAWPVPRWGGHFGRRMLLVSHMTVSAGENFAFYVQKLKLGTIVGTRTWGGLTGLNGNPALIDGGFVNVPNAPFFDESGWLIEGEGLHPDVAVERDPAAGTDAQLDAALARLMAPR
jgi:tricorn protease